MYPCGKLGGTSECKSFLYPNPPFILINPHNIFAFISDACTSVQQTHRVRSTPHPRTWSTSLPFSLSRQGMAPCEAAQVSGREGHCFRTQHGLAHQKSWMIPRIGGISYRCRDGTSDHLGGDSRLAEPAPLRRLAVGDFWGLCRPKRQRAFFLRTPRISYSCFSSTLRIRLLGSCSRG